MTTKRKETTIADRICANTDTVGLIVPTTLQAVLYYNDANGPAQKEKPNSRRTDPTKILFRI
jgi:hypothetical protein